MKTKNLSKLYLMVITVPKGKKEIIGDMLDYYGVTAFLSTLAHGSHENSTTKDVMFCIIKEEKIKDAILWIEDKFKKFHRKESMIYTIPLHSVIGVSSYMMLSNGGKA